MPITKVLLLTPQTPFPPDQGAPIRNFSFVRYLGGLPDYELSLLSFARSEEGHQAEIARQELQKYCKRLEIVPAPPTRSKISRIKAQILEQKPDLALRLASEKFAFMLQSWLKNFEFDAIQCEGLELAPFVMSSDLNWQKVRPRLILDEHNAEYLLQRRVYESERDSGLRRLPAALYSLLQAQRLQKYETEALKFFDKIIAVSDNEKAALARIAAGTNFTVIPNGIDLEEFSPLPESKSAGEQLVFSGTMDFRPNVDAVSWFARKVWPQIRQAKPQARFVIVGRRPTSTVLALREIAGIEVTGRVPDTRPYLASSQIFVLPMRMGGGVRLKLLEALAMQRAIVTTSFGADGVPLTNEREVLFANEPTEFARACLALLDNPARRAELAEAGRKFVIENYDWRKIAPLLDGVLK